jgi:hypothetical protein
MHTCGQCRTAATCGGCALRTYWWDSCVVWAPAAFGAPAWLVARRLYSFDRTPGPVVALGLWGASMVSTAACLGCAMHMLAGLQFHTHALDRGVAFTGCFDEVWGSQLPPVIVWLWAADSGTHVLGHGQGTRLPLTPFDRWGPGYRDKCIVKPHHHHHRHLY